MEIESFRALNLAHTPPIYVHNNSLLKTSINEAIHLISEHKH